MLRQVTEHAPAAATQGADALPPGEEHISALTGTLKGWLEPLTGHPWAQAGVVLAAFLVLAKVIDLLFMWCFRVLRRKSQDEAKVADELLLKSLRPPLRVSVVLIGIGVALRFLELPSGTSLLLSRMLWTIALLVWATAAFRSTGQLLHAASRNPKRFKAIQEPTFPLFNNLAKLLLFALFIYLGIKVWGWDATGWLASAGVAGLALGFAAQDTLSNLFAGVFILADRPYRVGDIISLDSGERGRISFIGLRSTRLLTQDEVEVTIPNAVMGGAKIVNESGGPRPYERIRISVGVAYGSDIDQVMRVLTEVGSEMDESKVLRHPKPHPRFLNFGASSLDFELMLWIRNPADRDEMLSQVNQGIYKAFAREGIEIPFSQHDIYIKELPNLAHLGGH